MPDVTVSVRILKVPKDGTPLVIGVQTFTKPQLNTVQTLYNVDSRELAAKIAEGWVVECPAPPATG